MKILVLSDSHGAVENMEVAVRLEMPDVIIHLGDYWRDACDLKEMFPGIPMYKVAGNCDKYFWQPGQDERLIWQFEGVLFYMVHGHQHGVKSGLLRLELAAREAGAKVALFGHTHRSYCEETDGILLMNPGACSGYGATYGILELEEGKLQCWEIRDL